MTQDVLEKLAGKKLPGKIIKNKIESSLRDSYYSLGFKKVKPLESIPGINFIRFC